MKQLSKTVTATFNISYHIIWCPKYRRCVLIDGVDTRLKDVLSGIASENGWVIKGMEVMPDHVHVFIAANPAVSPNYIVAKLKGLSARVLRKEFPHLKKRIPSLWTRSYYIESIGHISENTIAKYIQDQKNK